jgi:hypothetical protein
MAPRTRKRRNFSSFRQGLRCVAATGALLAGGVLPALADRHCGPVVDAYFQARAELLAPGALCEAALPAALLRMQEAAAAARACGCAAMEQVVQEALAPLPEGACARRRDFILELRDPLESAHETCH